MSKITSAFAAALIASASFASAALAADNGDYYDGVSKTASSQNGSVSYESTGSIGNASSDRGNGAEIKALPGTGSYYDGVNRPN